MQSGALRAVYLFDGYQLDPNKRELLSADRSITLTPHVFDCLTYLIEHRDRAIGRDELVAAVWGLTEVSETLLGQTIMHARRAVGDSGRDQTSIRTIPRFGYRWVRESVRALTPDAAASLSVKVDRSNETAETPPDEEITIAATRLPESTNPTAQKSARARSVRRSILLRLAIFLCAIAAISGIAFVLGSTNSSNTPATALLIAEEADLILVLPVSVQDSPEQKWIPLGIMDLIASRLRDGGWPVVPSATAIAIREQVHVPSIKAISHLSGARLVVSPKVSQNGTRWKVELGLQGRSDLPPQLDAEAEDLIAAAQLASDRLLALLQHQPLPEMAIHDPDLAMSQLVQQINAAFLAAQLDEAARLIAQAPAELRDRPEFQVRVAELEYRSGRLDLAQRAYQQLLDRIGNDGDVVVRARALIGLGSIARTRVDYAAAEALYRQAISTLESSNQPVLSGSAHAYLGVALGSLGRFDESADELSIARITLDMTGDEFGVAMVDSAFATMAADRHQLADAAPRMAKAIAKLEQLGAQAEANGLSVALTQMYRELLDHENAVLTAAKVWQQINDKPLQRLYYMAAAQYAWSLIEIGQLSMAERVLSEASSPTHSPEQGFQWRQMTLAHAQLDLWRGRETSALRRLDSVFSQADAVIDEPGPGWLMWLRQLRANNDPRLPTFMAQMEVWATDGGVEKQVFLQLAQAEAEWHDDQNQKAYAAYESALQSAERLGIPSLVARAAVPFGRALLGDGYLQRAGAVIGRLSPWAKSDFESAALSAALRRALQKNGSPVPDIDQLSLLAGERPLPEWSNATLNKH